MSITVRVRNYAYEYFSGASTIMTFHSAPPQKIAIAANILQNSRLRARFVSISVHSKSLERASVPSPPQQSDHMIE